MPRLGLGLLPQRNQRQVQKQGVPRCALGCDYEDAYVICLNTHMNQTALNEAVLLKMESRREYLQSLHSPWLLRCGFPVGCDPLHADEATGARLSYSRAALAASVYQKMDMQGLVTSGLATASG